MNPTTNKPDLDPYNDNDFISCILIVIRTIRRNGRWINWEEKELLSEAYPHALRIRDRWSKDKGLFMKYLFSSLPFRISDQMRYSAGHKRNPDYLKENESRFINKEIQIVNKEDQSYIDTLEAPVDTLSSDYDWENKYDWSLLTETEEECVRLRQRGINLKQTGIMLGLSESRICQIMSAVRQKWAHYNPENNNE